MKGAFFILVALFIDLLQAGISMGIATIAAFPGTAGGLGGGCAAGSIVAGKLGCWVGGAVLGIFGTLADPFVAPYTIPVGIALGFAVDVCISATLGAGLITLLAFNGMMYPKYALSGGILELLPGFDNLPGWTALTIGCIWEKHKRDKMHTATAQAAAVVAPAPAVVTASNATIVQPVDGIRLRQIANDNTPPYGIQAA